MPAPQLSTATASTDPTPPVSNRTDANPPGARVTGTASQRERRRRILDATVALASTGGYDAVQMRAVADHARVAVGTLYRYFPSKVHLLVGALGREFERIESSAPRCVAPGTGTPRERLHTIVRHITRIMQNDPLPAEAMTRAFMFADASASAEVDHVGRLMDRIFVRAITDGEPTRLQLDIARVISDVWLANLVAWLTHRSSATDVADRVGLAIDLLLDGTPSES